MLVLLHHQIEVACNHAGETFIFKAEIQQPFPVNSPGHTIRQYLPERNVVLPARRMPITATALPRTAGDRTSSRVSAGEREAKGSTILCRTISRNWLSMADTLSKYYPYKKDKGTLRSSG